MPVTEEEFVHANYKRLYVLVAWPESQRWMARPGVLLVEESAYMVPIVMYRAADEAASGGGEVPREESEVMLAKPSP